VTVGRSFRRTLAFYLDDIETLPGRAVNFTITGLVLISALIFVAETYPLLPVYRQWLEWVDSGVLWLFVVEYLVRLWCADNKVKHVLSLFSLLDLISLLPLLSGAFDIRFIRIFRWFRILRLIRFLNGNTIFGYVSQDDSLIFSRILFTLFAIIFIYSGLIYQVEHPINGKEFATFLDAIYFSVATMTTVGFGDVIPVSSAGRFLTVLMILTGV
jgi:voltage-gated potassium channel